MELKESPIFNEIGKLSDFQLNKIKTMVKVKFIMEDDIKSREGAELWDVACITLQDLVLDIYVALKRENINNHVNMRDIFLYDNIISLFWHGQLTLVKYDSSYKEITKSIYCTNILEENRVLKKRLEDYVILINKDDRELSIECNGYCTSRVYGRTLNGFENMASVQFDREYLKRGEFKFWNQEESDAWLKLKEFNDAIDKNDLFNRGGNSDKCERQRISLLDKTGRMLSLGDVFMVYAKYDNVNLKLVDELVIEKTWYCGYKKFNALSNSWLQRNINIMS